MPKFKMKPGFGGHTEGDKVWDPRQPHEEAAVIESESPLSDLFPDKFEPADSGASATPPDQDFSKKTPPVVEEVDVTGDFLEEAGTLKIVKKGSTFVVFDDGDEIEESPFSSVKDVEAFLDSLDDEIA